MSSEFPGLNIAFTIFSESILPFLILLNISNLLISDICSWAVNLAFKSSIKWSTLEVLFNIPLISDMSSIFIKSSACLKDFNNSDFLVDPNKTSPVVPYPSITFAICL